jgi:murein DD-endopeptidase MepM/ murein hydrolase activator NlpD
MSGHGMFRSIADYLLLICIIGLVVIMAFMNRDHGRAIDAKDAKYVSLWENYNLELDYGSGKRRENYDLSVQILDLEANMAKLSALQPLLGFFDPAEVITLVENLELSSPFESPYRVTSRYGEGPGLGGNYRTSHMGTDMSTDGSYYIHPMWPGEVIEVGIHAYYGKFIIVEHSPRVRTLYAHLDTIYYEADIGEHVQRETNMGLMGSTGNTSGAHLHIEMLIWDQEKWAPVDIYPFLEDRA